MKNILLTGSALLVLTLTAFAGGNENKNTEYTIDAAASKMKWVGKKVTGEHTGNISFKSGTIATEGNVLKAGNAVVDMNSITCTDIENPDYAGKLVGHLKGDDFFGVEKFSTAEFKMTTISPITDAIKGDNNYTVSGTLTIKGVTQPIAFPAKVTVNGKTLVVRADVTFDRTKFDIKYGSKSVMEGIGDKAIYDDVLLSFALVAKAK